MRKDFDASIAPGVSDFEALPGENGGNRRVGVEIGLGGLSPGGVDNITPSLAGGRQIRIGPARWRIEHSLLGNLDIYLNTSLVPISDTALARLGVQTGQCAIPVELVT